MRCEIERLGTDMNFPTHVLLGMAVGALFFGKPEIILLIGLGSTIPDLDRETVS